MPRAGRTCAGKTPEGTNCPYSATSGNRCEAHAAEYEEGRGTRASRGYDKAYDAARRKAGPAVAAGRAVCWRCGEGIAPGEEWHLGHADGGRIAGPEHARSCNLRAAGLKAAGRNWSPAAAPAPLSADLRQARVMARQRADRAAERRTARLAAREAEERAGHDEAPGA